MYLVFSAEYLAKKAQGLAHRIVTHFLLQDARTLERMFINKPWEA